MTAETTHLSYRINDRDEIVFVDEAWDRFARANGGEHLTADHVLKRRLWDFVSDAPTQQLYGAVFSRVRAGRAVRFEFRCDAPDRRRLLEMRVSPAPDGTVELRTRSLSEEARPAQILLDPLGERSDAMLRSCGWCKRIDAGGSWVEVEEAVARLRLFERPVLPQVTHGICDECLARVTADLDLS